MPRAAYLVGLLKADAVDVPGQSVGVRADDLLAAVAVFLVDSRDKAVPQAHLRAEHQEASQGTKLFPRLLRSFDALLAEAFDLPEPVGVLVENAQRVGAKLLDDLPRVVSVHVGNVLGQVQNDVGDVLGFQENEMLNLDLRAVLAVVDELALDAHALTDADSGEAADDGDAALGIAIGNLDLRVGLEAECRVAAFGVLVENAVNGAAEIQRNRGHIAQLIGGSARKSPRRRSILLGVPVVEGLVPGVTRVVQPEVGLGRAWPLNVPLSRSARRRCRRGWAGSEWPRRRACRRRRSGPASACGSGPRAIRAVG